MDVFIDNLKELISDSNLSLRQLAKLSSVSVMQYSRYLNGSIPTIDITMKMAKFFNCSLDFLFGLSQDKVNKKYKSYDYDMSKFIDNYKALLSKNKITHYKFMQHAPFDESIIRHWQTGSTPRLDVLYYIAKNLDGSIDELVGRK